MVRVLIVAGHHANEGFSTSVAKNVAGLLSQAGIDVVFRQIPFKETALHKVLSSESKVYPLQLEVVERNLNAKVRRLVSEVGADLAYTFHTTRSESLFWAPMKKTIAKSGGHRFPSFKHVNSEKLDFAIWVSPENPNLFNVEARSVYVPFSKKVSNRVGKNFDYGKGFGIEFREMYLSRKSSASHSRAVGLFPESLAKGIAGVIRRQIQIKSKEKSHALLEAHEIYAIKGRISSKRAKIRARKKAIH